MVSKKTCLALIIIMTLSLLLTSCLSKTSSPKKSVAGFLDSLKKEDIIAASRYVCSENNSTSDVLSIENNQDRVILATYSRLKYDIKSQKVTGNEASVNVNITSVDLVRISMDVISQLDPVLPALAYSDTSESQVLSLFNQYLINSLLDHKAPTVTSNVTINLRKVDKQWLIIVDNALINSITGNALMAFGN